MFSLVTEMMEYGFVCRSVVSVVSVLAEEPSPPPEGAVSVAGCGRAGRQHERQRAGSHRSCQQLLSHSFLSFLSINRDLILRCSNLLSSRPSSDPGRAGCIYFNDCPKGTSKQREGVMEGGVLGRNGLQIRDDAEPRREVKGLGRANSGICARAPLTYVKCECRAQISYLRRMAKPQDSSSSSC